MAPPVMAPPESCFVVTTASPPHLVKMASTSWHELWGFTPEEAVGKPVNHLLNGFGHSVESAATVASKLQAGDSSATRCVNTSRYGELYSHDLILQHEGADEVRGISTAS